jgi:hypothetical protein
MIGSKFSFRFYLGYIIGAAVLSIGLYGVLHPSQMIVVKHGVRENGIIVCYVLIGLGLASLAGQSIKTTLLKAWPDRLVIQRLFFHATIPKEDIVTIDLMGRKKLLSYSRLSSVIVIDRKQGKKIILPDQDYRNTPEIKRALQHYYLALPADQPSHHRISDPEVSNQRLEKYAGKWLLSGNGISLCVLSLFAVWLVFGTHAHAPVAGKSGLLLLIIILLYIPFGSQLYYFQVSDQALVVKNHLYPRYNRMFSLVDIRSVGVEDPRPGRVILHITTKDFQAARFSADSLRKPQWKALIQKLREKGIPVIDEAY